MKYYGAIEAGGTKFVCSILADPDHYFEEVRFPTTTPEETLERTVSFFKEHEINMRLPLSE
jgi:fructokinase